MALAQPARRVTEAEYLELERAAEIKSEFFDGEMFAMSGGTLPHGLIAANMISELGQRLKGKSCVAYTSDVKVKVEATGLFAYPDISIVCGPAQTLDDRDDTLLNPRVLVEVLSPSTEAYDRTIKFDHYRRIPSLQEYLLVSQGQARVDQMIRQENEDWLLRTVTGADAVIDLPALGISIALAEIYFQVQFPAAPARPVLPRQG